MLVNSYHQGGMEIVLDMEISKEALISKDFCSFRTSVVFRVAIINEKELKCQMAMERAPEEID